MDDNKIIDLYWERSESAIGETAKKYSRYCHTISFNILHNAEDAEECVSDTYMGAWKSMPPKLPNCLAAFLGKITRNLSLDRLKMRLTEKRGFGQAEGISRERRCGGMNSEMLLYAKEFIIANAFGDISDEYIIEAGPVSAEKPEQIKQPLAIKPRRKIFIGLVAAIALLMMSFLTAMAVNEDFREAVLAFFKISVTENVPDISPDEQFRSHGDITNSAVSEVWLSEEVLAKYLLIPGWSNPRYGLIYRTDNPPQHNSGEDIRYELYAEENGEIIPVPTYSVNIDCRLGDRNYHIEFEWGAYGNNLGFAYIAESDDWHVSSIVSNTEHAIVNLSGYPMLIDLKNEELVNIFEGCGIENVDISPVALASDFSWALFTKHHGYDSGGYDLYTLYYCDVSAKKLYDIDELSGQHADACVIIGDKLVCWERGSDGLYDCWSINLETFEREEVFEDEGRVVFISGFDIMRHSGWTYPGCGFALQLAEDRSVYVIDLATGEKTVIDGFSWPENVIDTSVGSDMQTGSTILECVPNPTGAMLLIYEYETGAEMAEDEQAVFGYNRVNVIDFFGKRLISLERKGFSAHEFFIEWFDENRIIVNTYQDGAFTDRAVYVYRFDD